MKPGTTRVTTSTQIAISFKRRDGVQHGVQLSAQLLIVLLAEALQVDLEEIDVGAEILQDLRCAVAVRNIGTPDAVLLRQRERSQRPIRM